jgi:hypothetical protein
MVKNSFNDQVRRAMSIGLCSFLFAAIIYGQELQHISVIVPKQKFLVGEPVEIAVNIFDAGDVSSGDTTHVGALYIYVFDEAGKKLQWTGNSGNGLWITKYDRINTNEYYRTLNIEKWYGTVTLFTHRYFKPGKYNIQLKYESSEKKEEILNITFEVRPPEGDEAFVYQEFRAALTPGPQNSHEKFTHFLENLIDKYPHTVYGPEIFMNLSAEYHIVRNDEQKGLETDKKFIKMFPHSVRTGGFIERVSKSFSTETEKKAFIKEIHAASKNSIMEKYIEIHLPSYSKE